MCTSRPSIIMGGTTCEEWIANSDRLSIRIPRIIKEMRSDSRPESTSELFYSQRKFKNRRKVASINSHSSNASEVTHIGIIVLLVRSRILQGCDIVFTFTPIIILVATSHHMLLTFFRLDTCIWRNLRMRDMATLKNAVNTVQN